MTKDLTQGFDLDRRFRLDLLRLLNLEYLLSEYPLRGQGVTLVHAPKEWPKALHSRDPNTGLANGDTLSVSAGWHELMAANARKRAGKDLFIYRLENAVPRVRLVQHVQSCNSTEEALNSMAALSGSHLQTTVVSEDNNAAQAKPFSTGTITRFTSSGDTRMVEVQLHQPIPGLLAIAENWSPFWQAQVDDEQTPVLRINHTQMGVMLPPGAHRVELSYRPFY